MTELESALVALGRDIEFPPTPDVAGAVRRRLAERSEGRRLHLPARRTLVLAFAVLAVVVGAVMAVPPARTAVLELLGLRGATVERVETLPALPQDAAGELMLGRPLPLEEARGQAGFEVLVPSDPGEPDRVFYSSAVPGGRVSLVYSPSGELPPSRFTDVGLLVTEFDGTLAPELIGKLVEGSTTAERVSVDGRPGVWIEGPPHVFFYRNRQGDIVDDTTRLAGNTLLVQWDGVLVRLEGSSSLARERALEIARSLG